MRTWPAKEPRPLLLLADDDSQIRQLLSEVGDREKFELRNVIERACLLCEGHLLTEADLSRSLTERPAADAGPDDERDGPPPDRDEVRAALEMTGGNQSLAARRRGISRRALYRLIDKYGTPAN